MTEDQKLASLIQEQGSYERAQREAEEAIISRNVQRWQHEQEVRKEKVQKLEALARLKGISVKELREQRHAKYLLANCRATLAQIVEAHAAKGGTK